MAKPPSHSSNVSARAYRGSGREVAQLMEVACDAKVLGCSLVVVGQSVGFERRCAGGQGGQDEGIRYQRRADHHGVGPLVPSTLHEER